MTETEVLEYIGYLVGSFSVGYVSGFALQYFKKAAGLIR